MRSRSIRRGTALHVISYHDNTEAHRGNVDPKNWTGGGSRTVDEMAFSWISWFDLTEEQYKAALEQRLLSRYGQ